MTVSPLIAACFCVWWCAAAGVLTFSVPGHTAPSGSLSNAYGSLWLGAACSNAMISKACLRAPNWPLSKSWQSLACSIVVLIAILTFSRFHINNCLFPSQIDDTPYVSMCVSTRISSSDPNSFPHLYNSNYTVSVSYAV